MWEDTFKIHFRTSHLINFAQKFPGARSTGKNNEIYNSFCKLVADMSDKKLYDWLKNPVKEQPSTSTTTNNKSPLDIPKTYYELDNEQYGEEFTFPTQDTVYIVVQYRTEGRNYKHPFYVPCNTERIFRHIVNLR